jgi:hypothetical protein
MSIPFIGKRMSRSEFAAYLKTLQFNSGFKPEFVTLHHTASPSLAQRPSGFSAQHLKNLLDYYQNQLGWNGAPHVFIDDQNDGIIVFQRMDRRGVHAVSFNKNSWGVEMLGDFDSESFTSGRGAKVRQNSLVALDIMCKALKASPDSIKFHRDDPKTSKTCPGRNVTKSDIVNGVKSIMNVPLAPDKTPRMSSPSIIMPNQAQWTNTREKDERIIVRARDFIGALDPGAGLALSGMNVVISKAGKANKSIVVAELDENNRAWVFARDAAEALGFTISWDAVKNSAVIK